jgi:hypothetical protein
MAGSTSYTISSDLGCFKTGSFLSFLTNGSEQHAKMKTMLIQRDSLGVMPLLLL